jgi:starch synthase
MRVLHAAAEYFPLARTGGLGDVLAALPRAQNAAGLDARVILPGWPAVLGALSGIRQVATIPDRFGASAIALLRGTAPGDGTILYALDAPGFYDRAGGLYQGPDRMDWPDNDRRFGLFCWVSARLAQGLLDPDWRADVLHAHDWHAGLGPAYLELLPAAGKPPASVFTVHNLAYQGLFPAESAASLDLPAQSFQPSGLEFWGKLSFIKAGIVYADRVTTVSPGYAREIATPEFGCGLDGVIRDRGARVSGILNGVDVTQWDPATDPALTQNFDADQIERRAANRTALLREFGLTPPTGPLYGVVSRLTEQKGLDLVLAALPRLLAVGGSLALLGAGDAPLEREFRAAAAEHPGRVGVTIGYDDALSHRMMAGSDVVLVPSRFEPCGLTQLYALRYGAVPLVRRTGGLGDTVDDATESALADGSATGFVFDDPDPAALAQALGRVAVLFGDQPAWARLQQAGMHRRFSWASAAERYRALYERIAG